MISSEFSTNILYRFSCIHQSGLNSLYNHNIHDLIALLEKLNKCLYSNLQKKDILAELKTFLISKSSNKREALEIKKYIYDDAISAFCDYLRGNTLRRIVNSLGNKDNDITTKQIQCLETAIDNLDNKILNKHSSYRIGI